MVNVGCRNAGDGGLRRRRQQFRFHDHDEIRTRRLSGSEDRADRKIIEKISEQKGHVGSREKTTTTFSKTYHYERLDWAGKPETDIVMECIEYQLTAP
jgi:hypothetical protein